MKKTILSAFCLFSMMASACNAVMPQEVEQFYRDRGLDNTSLHSAYGMKAIKRFLLDGPGFKEVKVSSVTDVDELLTHLYSIHESTGNLEILETKIRNVLKSIVAHARKDQSYHDCERNISDDWDRKGLNDISLKLGITDNLPSKQELINYSHYLKTFFPNFTALSIGTPMNDVIDFYKTNIDAFVAASIDFPFNTFRNDDSGCSTRYLNREERKRKEKMTNRAKKIGKIVKRNEELYSEVVKLGKTKGTLTKKLPKEAIAEHGHLRGEKSIVSVRNVLRNCSPTSEHMRSLHYKKSRLERGLSPEKFKRPICSVGPI